MSLGNPPEVALWLSIPDNCRMRGGFEVGDSGTPDIHVAFWSNGDDTNLLFERAALEWFVALAQRMLAVPDPHARLVSTRAVLESRAGQGIQDVSTVAVA